MQNDISWSGPGQTFNLLPSGKLSLIVENIYDDAALQHEVGLYYRLAWPDTLAADALATIGGPAVPDLLEVAQNGGQGARLEAIRALATIGDQRSLPLLFSLLDGESALMEYWANEGLERMGVGMAFFKP